MKRLRFQRANNLAQLHGELLAALPELRMTLEVLGTGDAIDLGVPDETPDAPIAAVVAAHVPVAPPAPPSAPSPAQLTALRDFMSGATPGTIAGLAAVLRAFVTLYRYREGREE